MFQDLIDVISDYIQNSDGHGVDFDSISDYLLSNGIDLSNFTADEIREALDDALSDGDNLSDVATTAGHNISFEGGYYSSSVRDEALAQLKDQLSSKYISTGPLWTDDINGGLNYDSTTSLERTLRNAVADGKLSSSELEQIFNKLNVASKWFNK